MTVFEGRYRDYLRARDAERQAAAQTQSSGPTPKPKAPERPPAENAEKLPRLSPYQRQRRLEAIEAHIQQLDEQLAALTEQIGLASQQQAVARVRELGEQYAATEAALEAAMREWETLLE